MAATDAAASTPPSTARDRQSAAAAPTAVVSAVSGLIAAGVSGEGCTVMAPVASTKTVSPSIGVCTGRIARASPSWAATATRWQADLLSAASVAITAMVVFSGLVWRTSAA